MTLCSSGPDHIFKFTSQPVSQTVKNGESVTLSCVATGRTDITYSWYKLPTEFTNPPSETLDLINGAAGTRYVLNAADVDGKMEGSLFQCKATAEDDVLRSKIATVNHILAGS